MNVPQQGGAVMQFGECPSFKAGQHVRVFYRMDKQPAEYRYIAVESRQAGIFRPRHGLSEGWMPAVIVEDFDPSQFQQHNKSTWVKINYCWSLFYDKRGIQVDEDNDMNDCYLPQFVQVCAPNTSNRPFCPAIAPQIGFVVFRWGARNACAWSDQWGDTGSSVSDAFIRSFFDRAVVPRLGTDYEVWTVYIESATDFDKFADCAHLIFGPTHPIRRCKHIAALYYLYPTQFKEDCVPFVETGSDGGAGHVHVEGMFRGMRAMEKAGVPTRFPHPSNLYQMLAAKNWTYFTSICPELSVPATCSPNRAQIEYDIKGIARKTIAQLEAIKRAQGRPGKVTKGVCKLGYSWEGLDVKFWNGEEGLVQAFKDLQHSVYINNEPVGQAHDCDTMIVQEFIPYDLEMRMYVVEGKVEATIYTKFCSINEANDFKEFRQHDRKEATEYWLGGDVQAMANAELQGMELINRWLIWLTAQTCEAIPAIRFDFFVCRVAPGQTQVYIAEICELGFSMLGYRKLPNKVFKALLKYCLGELPDQMMRPCDYPADPVLGVPVFAENPQSYVSHPSAPIPYPGAGKGGMSPGAGKGYYGKNGGKN